MMIYACCQLARRYKLPVRTGGMLNDPRSLMRRRRI